MSINLNQGFKPQRVTVGIKNAEASASIPAGSPVTLIANGTDDGLAVVLPSSGVTAMRNQGLKYGVNTALITTGQYGNAVVHGMTNNLLLQRQTRGNSTDVWATQAVLSIGQYLTVDSTNNRFITTVSTIGVVTNATTDTLALTIYNPDYVAFQSLASFASSASSTADTRTAITASIKAFVRIM